MLRHFLLASLLTLAPLSSAVAQDAPPAGYDARIDSAVTEFAAGRWQEARALFLEAHALYPNARTLRGIGMSSYELRDYAEAARALEAALSSTTRPLTDEQRTQVQALLEQARAFIGRFVVPAAPEGSRLYVDGARAEIDASWPAEAAPIVLAIGEHTIEIRHDGAIASTRLQVRGRTDEPLDIDLAPLTPASPPPAYEGTVPPPPPPPASVDPGPFVLIGTGLGVALIGGILYGVGWVDIGTVQTGGRDWVELQGAYDRAPILTGVGGTMLGVGLGAAAIGALWAILAQPSASADPHRTLQIVVGPSSLGVEGTF